MFHVVSKFIECYSRALIVFTLDFFVFNLVIAILLLFAIKKFYVLLPMYFVDLKLFLEKIALLIFKSKIDRYMKSDNVSRSLL